MPEYVVNYAATQTADQEGRLDAPSFHRNRDPIWSVLGPFLADRSGDVLEVGSGTGQHVVEFARRAPAIRWQPSDLAPEHLRSIEAWRTTSGLANVRAPIAVDLSVPDWPSQVEATNPGSLLAILCINVLHISPWRVSEHLLAGVPRLIRPDGRLFVYGPFKRGGAHTSPSNADFDASLRAGNPEWGVRDMDDLGALATRSGLVLADAVAMPANNFVLVFERRG
jgi:SAM-dependent methyltransferase